MSKIQRYVIIDILRVLLAVLVATSVIFTLVAGVREGVRKGLPPNVVVQALPYMLPEMLRLTIPASLLFAICTVFGRMAASEEITALKSVGINPLRVVMPVLVLAYVLSLVTFWLYDACAVWSRPGRAAVAEFGTYRHRPAGDRCGGVFHADLGAEHVRSDHVV